VNVLTVVLIAVGITAAALAVLVILACVGGTRIRRQGWGE
jgi:hypothetical protein